MADIAKLEVAARKANVKLHAAQAEAHERKNRTLVGRCFKYHNSSGDPEKWWMYLRVVRVEGNAVLCHRFEMRPNGLIEIEFEYPKYFGLTEGYERITAAEFAKAWQALQKTIGSTDLKGGSQNG